MGYVIRMPQLGMSMEEGTVVSWEVEEGTSVEADDVLVVIESEKTSIEVEAREAGELGRVLVGEGIAVEPGDPIGILVGPDEDPADYEKGLDVPTADDGDEPEADDAGDGVETEADAGDGVETEPDVDGARAGARAEPTATAGAEGAADPTGAAGDVRATPGARQLAEAEGVELASVEGTGPQGVVTDDDVARAAAVGGAGDVSEVRATPGARRLAEETGVELAGVDGTGPRGVVTDEDVEAHAAATGASAGEPTGGASRTVVEATPLSGMQGTIAERLGRSYREAVHVTLDRSFDAATLRDAVEAGREAGAQVSMTDLLLKAAGVALEEHPDFNAVFEEGEHRLVEEVNVAVAVDVERGLVTPVVPDVGSMSVEAVAAVRRDLTDRVLDDAFDLDDLAGGTFTVTNLGPFDVDSFTPVIDPPQVAILGVGRVREDGSMTLSLSFDHRVVNGADAARFLDTLVEAASDPGTLAGCFDANVTVGGGRAEETREVTVASAAGLSGTYRVAGREVAFDEPTDVGGSGQAPTPVEHLLGALGSCLALSLRTMADRDGLDLGRVEVNVVGRPASGPLEAAEVALAVESDAAEDDLERAVTKAERACYVERALAEDVDVAVTWTRP